MVKPFQRFGARPAAPRREDLDAPYRVIEPIPIPDHDPLMGYLLGATGPVEVDKIELDSPTLTALREAGTHLLVPLVSQGELIGTLNLGRRLSDQPYSTDDRKLLRGLAAQVAPAIRLAQLVEQQQEAAKERERISQELRVAALIQQTLLPKELPSIPGWDIDAYYRPAREVGGDFYDFIPLSGGRLAVVIGDVTDKGVPAAIVMATTRSTLRAAMQLSDDPAEILRQVNDVLVDEIPPAMFVTCLVGVLEPSTGVFSFANAGHNLPYVRTGRGVVEIRATGMPLGLMPGMDYPVTVEVLEPGAAMLLTSDGIVEAHGPDGTMFGFSRLMGLVGSASDAEGLMSSVIADLDRFCGPGTDQEDDVTMVTVRRIASAAASAAAFHDDGAERVDEFTIPSNEGAEREVMTRIASVASGLGLSGERLERLKTAVSEAAMNAIEHGNGFDPALDVRIAVLRSRDRLIVRMEDHGQGPDVASVATPDIDAKLAGLQNPRGWGLFLISEMVDDLRQQSVDGRHAIELEMRLEGATG